MIILKSASDINYMKQSGAILRDTLLAVEEKIKPGVSTKQLDIFVNEYITKRNAIPSELGYYGYPASICASIDEVVVHGIPSANQILKEGQIISIDVCVLYKGWQTDAARTFLVGEVSPEKAKLVEDTRKSFFEGVKQFKEGNRLGDISHAIQVYNESRGYGVIRSMVGHGIGRDMHEDPQVPNYGKAGHGPRLQKGMTLAIEPMISLGDWETKTLSDGWTTVTVDGSPCAHYENTVALTDNGAEILTL